MAGVTYVVEAKPTRILLPDIHPADLHTEFPVLTFPLTFLRLASSKEWLQCPDGMASTGLCRILSVTFVKRTGAAGDDGDGIAFGLSEGGASLEIEIFRDREQSQDEQGQEKKQSVFDRIGKVESRQSVFNRLGASPKEVSPKEVKRKSVHERLGPVAIIKKYTKSPLSIEPSKEIKSAVPSRMRREADVHVLCGEVLKARPKIIVHTSVQEENEESMKSSYATYQDVQDVEAPKNWRVIAWP
nr:uncharacterized protein LOC109150426 [Ipomoea batatas]